MPRYDKAYFTAYESLHAADRAWSDELINVYGKNAANARYNPAQQASTLRLKQLLKDRNAAQVLFDMECERCKKA
jgi:hypothetical protein